ncbi:MAG: hypothetical protein ACYCVB_16875 [Bacilli bacterium]
MQNPYYQGPLRPKNYDPVKEMAVQLGTIEMIVRDHQEWHQQEIRELRQAVRKLSSGLGMRGNDPDRESESHLADHRSELLSYLRQTIEKSNDVIAHLTQTQTDMRGLGGITDEIKQLRVEIEELRPHLTFHRSFEEGDSASGCTVVS